MQSMRRTAVLLLPSVVFSWTRLTIVPWHLRNIQKPMVLEVFIPKPRLRLKFWAQQFQPLCEALN